jgi:allantoate deiminase
VIPGLVEFTIDMRGPSDVVRQKTHKVLADELRQIAVRRQVSVDIDTYQENPATAFDHDVIAAAAEAIAALGHEPLRLPSGAGHDAMIMAKLCPSGMIFVRCKDGVSHNPAESISVEDAGLAVAAMLEATRRLDRKFPTKR